MNDYVELRLDLTPCSETATDILAALLADVGYESFVPDQRGLTAYIPVGIFSEEDVATVCASFPIPDVSITARSATIEGKDWNSEWEKNYFKPIVVGERCVIHSSFHRDIPRCDYDIIIDPKMAFGTGHHATTSLIIEQLLDMNLAGKTVIDMGTGTGILAILSAMRGATQVYGIEIDPAAFANAEENIRLNNHNDIHLMLGDASRLEQYPQAQVFIANINRNIITSDLTRYASRLADGGTMLLSGFYEADIPVIMAHAAPLGLREVAHTTKPTSWTCLRLSRP